MRLNSTFKGIFLSLVFFLPMISHGISDGISDSDFEKQYCDGDCKSLLTVPYRENEILTPAEQYAIEYYTAQSQFLDLKFFIQAVQKIPIKDAVLFRGTSKNKTNISRVGDIVLLRSVTSASTDREIALNFVKDRLLIISSNSSRSIEKYSVAGEQEHILLPGTKLRVKSLRNEVMDLSPDPSEKMERNVQVVELEEL